MAGESDDLDDWPGEYAVTFLAPGEQPEEIHRGPDTAAFLRGFLRRRLPPEATLEIRSAEAG